MTEHAGDPTFLALLDEIRSVHKRKAAGYAGLDQPDTWTNFREASSWGLTPLQGCLVRLGDKYRRTQNLIRNPANDQVGEAVRDTLMDLANYALIAVCLMEETKPGQPPWLAEAPRCGWNYPPCNQPAHRRDGGDWYCDEHALVLAEQIATLDEIARDGR